MKTAKEVNPDLYAMRNKHLLDLDQKSNTWAIYRPGRPFTCCPHLDGAEGRAVKRKHNTQYLVLAGLPLSSLPAPPCQKLAVLLLTRPWKRVPGGRGMLAGVTREGFLEVWPTPDCISPGAQVPA